jgi:HEAT repeat protein
MSKTKEIIMKPVFITCLAVILSARLASADKEMQNAAQERVEIQRCMSVLKDEKSFSENPVAAGNAIMKLGQLGAVEAIPLLIQHIDFCDTRLDVPSRGYSPENCRVALEALVNIGKDSLQPVLEASKKEDNRLRQICMAAVIRELQGKKKAPELLDEHIAQSPDPKVKDRLEKIKDFIATPPSS